jgi:S1-C subfamily serine protease
MDQIPAPAPAVGPAPRPVPARLARRPVVPTVVAALALGSAGTGAGYAVARLTGGGDAAPLAASTSGTSPGSPSDGLPGSTSQQWYPPMYGSTPQGSDPFGSQPQDGDSTDTSSTATAAQLTGLVRIVSTMRYDGAKAAGTGMVLASSGEVATNHHVVEGATRIRVTVMSTGHTYTARVVGTDASVDVAVLQLAGASGLATVTPDTDGVATGEAVTAVGDGNGTVSHLSAVTGTVLATRQSITTQSEGTASGERLSGLIEISSDVVGGYSGGATYDADGEVVGMTTAASSGGTDVVGYAVPVATVLDIASDLEAGVTDADYAYGYPAFLGVGLGSGTTVQGVYDATPAAQAGMSAGDTITAVGGTRTTTAARLRAAIASHRPGDAVSVTWSDAAGASHTATVTLGKGPVA